MRLTYFISNFVPVVLALIIIWRKGGPLLRKTLPILLILGFLGLVNALGENPALHWGFYSYNQPKTLGITIQGVLFETYIYCVLVPIAIGSAAIKFAERQDKKSAKRK